MTNQEFQELVEINKKLGGKYDAIVDQLAEDLELDIAPPNSLQQILNKYTALYQYVDVRFKKVERYKTQLITITESISTKYAKIHKEIFNAIKKHESEIKNIRENTNAVTSILFTGLITYSSNLCMADVSIMTTNYLQKKVNLKYVTSEDVEKVYNTFEDVLSVTSDKLTSGIKSNSVFSKAFEKEELKLLPLVVQNSLKKEIYSTIIELYDSLIFCLDLLASSSMLLTEAIEEGAEGDKDFFNAQLSVTQQLSKLSDEVIESVDIKTLTPPVPKVSEDNWEQVISYGLWSVIIKNMNIDSRRWFEFNLFDEDPDPGSPISQTLIKTLKSHGILDHLKIDFGNWESWKDEWLILVNWAKDYTPVQLI
jgi:hypothetical protein